VDGSKRAPAPWVIVAGGFHQDGGMDKANAALATFLLERGTPLHLVAHRVDPELSARPGVRIHLVPKPVGSFFLGEWMLDRSGRAVARRVVTQSPGARVVVNGGNCIWPDINWVHSFHHAWPCMDAGAPIGFRVRNRITKSSARRRERLSIPPACVVLTNSEKTRRDVIGFFGIEPHKVHMVYLGTNPMWKPATSAERTAARAWLGQSEERPLVVFVGALGLDQNKGFDTLWRAWQALCVRKEWDANLIVAGDGNGLRRWKVAVREAGLESRVRFLGFTDRVRDLLPAADLLVSPVRYEAFGLNVQEAICRGIPALVSDSAGIAELFPAELSAMLLPNSADTADLAYRLRRWRSNMNYWKEAFQPFSNALRKYTWKDMARRIVEIAECEERSSLDPLGQAAGVPAVERAAHDLELKA
jgi:glycosyltransferase involved in cell wall biosynthesis